MHYEKHPFYKKQFQPKPYNGFDLDDALDLGGEIASGNWGAVSDKILGEITKIIKGRPYTTGKYKLAEKYIRHVQGKAITSTSQVPDPVVNESIDFFTKKFGIPIVTVEDLNNLDAGDMAAYYARDPLFKVVPRSAVENAIYMKSKLPYTTNANGTGAIWNFNQFPPLPGAVGTALGNVGEKLQETKGGLPVWLWVVIGLAVAGAITFMVVKSNKK